MIVMPKYTHIIPHHSTTADGRTFNTQGIWTYHMSYRVDYHIVNRGTFLKKKKGYDLGNLPGKHNFQYPWRDVGYYFLIEYINGWVHIIVGRPLTDSGAHCPQERMNQRGIGICYIGDFDRFEPPKEVLEISSKRLIIPLMAQFKIPVKNILGHRDIKGVKKSCPGKKFDLDTLRIIVKRAI